MSKDEFQRHLSVSRETIDRLDKYEALITKWNPKINLVASSTLEDIWVRHFLDSAQLASLAPNSGVWLDLGSGGGFPALVIASMLSDTHPDVSFILVESDTRKAVFLRTVIRELELNAKVLSERIEKIPAQHASVLSARALDTLKKLVGYAKIHLNQDGTAFFPKGSSHKNELEQARETWFFDVRTIPSITDTTAAIFAIKDIQRAK